MDILWSPWRYDYLTTSPKPEGCVFCSILNNNSASDEETYILKRAEFNFVILNAYPYGSGHLLIIPYEHLANLDAAGKKATDEMMDLSKTAQTALRKSYSPDGVNLGMNLGRSAGAGVAGHFHMHVLPRWTGDVNFLTTIAETRTIPEPLTVTYSKLKPHF